MVVLCPFYARVLTRLYCCHSMDFDHLGRPQGLWPQQLAADYPFGKTYNR
jgi:hypothetical protein